MDIGKLPALPSLSSRPAPGQAPGRDLHAAGHGLVPLASPHRRLGERSFGPRPSPEFLAHLIATAQHAPQTRARSRTAPADAIARYDAARVGAPPRARGWSV